MKRAYLKRTKRTYHLELVCPACGSGAEIREGMIRCPACKLVWPANQGFETWAAPVAVKAGHREVIR